MKFAVFEWVNRDKDPVLVVLGTSKDDVRETLRVLLPGREFRYVVRELA